MPTDPQIIQAPCNDCAHHTDHKVLKAHTTTETEVEPAGSWETTYEMLECCGCHSISLRRSITSSEEQQPRVQYYPPPILRRKPNWYDQLYLCVPLHLGLLELMDKIYAALHADSLCLAAMGARAALDIAIVHAVGDAGSFKDKLAALQKNDHISNRQRDFLLAALHTGSAAAHRGHRPTAQQLNQVMDIVESVLQQIFVLPYAAADLKKSTPPRKPTRS